MSGQTHDVQLYMYAALILAASVAHAFYSDDVMHAEYTDSVTRHVKHPDLLI